MPFDPPRDTLRSRRFAIPLASTRFAEIFCTVVENGSYTAAARRLGVTPAAVSRAIARHEGELEVRLFHRTTRKITLTDPGRHYYEQCRQALALLEEAERSLSLQERGEPRGPVRISVPTTYGHYRLLPALGEFANRYPKVRLEVNLSNENVDFVGDRFELAIRRGEIPDSTFVVRKLEDAPVGVFASPSYIVRHGAPEHPNDLGRYTCIPYVLPSTGRSVAWGFKDLDGTPFEVDPPDRLRCSGDVLGCLTMARHGIGLVQAYGYLVEEDLRQGRLVEVLTRFAGRSSPFSLVRPSRRGLSLAVRVLSDAIVAHCSHRVPPSFPRRAE